MSKSMEPRGCGPRAGNSLLKRTSWLWTLATVALLWIHVPARGQYLFWNTNTGDIIRASLDGTDATTIVTNSSRDQMAFHEAEQTIYWTNGQALHRSNLDGSHIQSVLTAPAPLFGIAFDSANQEIFLSTHSMIWRVQGSALAPIATRRGSGNRLAVDPVQQKVYWTETLSANPPHHIRRANYDGSNFEAFIDVTLPRDLEVDITHGKFYWSSGIGIERINLDGTNRELIVPFPTVLSPNGISLDRAGQKTYWLEYAVPEAKIQRANLDGTGIEDVVTGLNSVPDIVIVNIPEPSVAILATALVFGFARNPFVCRRRPAGA